ncbi:MAG: class I adenylate-forming enzyme family protein [Alkalilacustris sp.]
MTVDAAARSGRGPAAGARSLVRVVARHAGVRPAALALSAHSRDGRRHRLDYAALHAAAGGWACWLAAAGLGTGERLAVLLDNDAALECILAALGAWHGGAAVVPCNPRWSDAELSHALDLTGPAVVLADAAGRARLSRVGAPGVWLDVTVGPGASTDGSDRPAPADPPCDPDTLASLLFTSGTTARAKAVMHSHATTLAAGRACAAALGLVGDDVYQGAFPFFTSSALNIACAACWSAGAGFVIEHQVTTEARMALIASEGATVYHGVPSVLHFMAEAAAAGGHPLPRLRCMAFGGAPMPADTRARLARLWPHARQRQIYGATESGPAGTVIDADGMQAHPTGVGRAMPGYSVHLVAADGAPPPLGAVGEVVLEGPGVALGYWRDPEATARAFRTPGPGRRAVRMGDAGRLTADGVLLFEDRAADRINRGGFKISSVAVETALLRDPVVLEAAVVGAPHPDLGEDVAAFIVPRPGAMADPEALAAGLRDAVSPNAIPRQWVILDALPRNAMGKVLKSLLRARLADPAAVPPSDTVDPADR